MLDLAYTFSKLIDALSSIIGLARLILCAKVPPLKAINGSQIALPTMRQALSIEKGSRAVSIPNLDAFCREQGRIGRPSNEPE